jgi:peroxiredoxin Q/BCP
MAAAFFGAAIMNPVMAELKPGDTAPDFELRGSDGKNYKLADFQGKSAVVLAWYPKAKTGG